MDWQRAQIYCSKPASNQNLFDEVWSGCKKSMPELGALMFGTIDGVTQEGTLKIQENPSRAVYETAGAVGLGLALKASPKYVAIPAAIVGGAGTMSYVQDLLVSVKRVIPALSEATMNPERARGVVARELGPLAFEGVSMCAIGAFTAAYRGRLESRARYSSVPDIGRQQASIKIDSRSTINDFRSYKSPVLSLKECAPEGKLSEFIRKGNSATFVRDALGSKDLRLTRTNFILPDDLKHTVIRNWKPNFGSSHNRDFVVVPELTREYTGISSVLRAKDHPEARLYESARKGVVHVKGEGSDGACWSGSGFAVSEDGKIATALHVLADARKVHVTTSDGTRHEAALIAHDFDTDLAILKIAAKTDALKPLPLAQSARPSTHEVFLFGHPAGSRAMFMSPGLFHRLGKEQACLNYKFYQEPVYKGRPYETSAYFAHDRTGHSGGPVLDAQGRVIAVHTDGDVYSKGSYDEIRVGVGTSVRELSRLLASIPSTSGHSGKHQVWTPLVQLDLVKPKRQWWQII